MKAGIYLGKENVEVSELPLPEVGDNDVLIQNICSSICGTDVAVFKKGPKTGHKIAVGMEFGHETISRVYAVGKNITEFKVGQRVYPYPRFVKNDTRRAGTIGGFSENILDIFMQQDKIGSRFISVAVNNAIRKLDLLHMTYAQKSIIGSGGYMPADICQRM
ncbi:MAG: alcohol dehydrogenase catalytic domain-containing protein [Lachnospiraceae bacterium]|nr:alcohol dehydrogenase catalytic domain-containing protein [Lachnospiraceae bacterium]